VPCDPEKKEEKKKGKKKNEKGLKKRESRYGVRGHWRELKS